MTLQERCKIVWDKMGVEKEKQEMMLKDLTPEAIANKNLITDEFIHNSTVARLLFWDLGNALSNYLVCVEKINNS